MPKLEALNDLTTLGSAVPTINDNFDKITTALNNTLSRDGSTPNTMSADLDMNSNDILNVNKISVQTFEIDGLNLEDYTNRVEEAAESVKNFTLFDSRANIVTYLQTQSVVTGRTYIAEGVSYTGLVGATVIPDLPGLVPSGDWTPMHFGCKGDGVTDDGALLNVALAAMKTAINAIGSQIGCITMDGKNKQYRSTISLNWTNIVSFGGWKFKDMTILSEATGKIAWDAIGARGGAYDNVTIIGHASSTPAFGFVEARGDSAAQFAFASHVEHMNVKTRGMFSVAACYSYGQERSNWYACEYWNDHPAGACHTVAAVDLYSVTSDHTTIITGRTPGLGNTYIGCEYRKNPQGSFASITGYTATNPLTVTLANQPTTPFQVGDVVVFGGIEAPTQLNNLEATITGVSGLILTFAAVDASAWVGSLTGTGAAISRKQTAPSLVLGGALNGHTWLNCYCVTYGNDQIEVRFPATEIRQMHDIRMPGMRFEGFGCRSHIAIYPGDKDAIIRRFEMTTWRALARDAVIFTVNEGASSRVRMFSVDLDVETTTAPAAPVIFGNPSLVQIYGGRIGSYDAASFNQTLLQTWRGQRFNHGTGQVSHDLIDLVGDTDFVEGAQPRARMNAKDTTGTVRGFLDYDMSGNAWRVSTNGSSTDYLGTSSAFYPNTASSRQLGLTTRRWSTVWGDTGDFTDLPRVAAGSYFGYGTATNTGGSFGQAGSKSGTVTGNRRTGRITTHNAALAAGTSVIFTVNNSTVLDTSLVMLNVVSPADKYTATICAKAAGSFNIRLTNITGGSLSEQVVIDYALIEGRNS